MAAQDALEAAVTAGSVDEGLIRTRAADVAAVEADETVLHARVYSEVLQVLTSDQQAKLKTFQAEMRQRRQQRGNGGSRGPKQEGVASRRARAASPNRTRDL